MKKLLFVAAARPNFMKIAPVFRQVQSSGLFNAQLVHTGQHYDANMSDVFFEELGIPRPNFTLNISGGHQNSQLAQVIAAVDKLIEDQNPDMVVVVGDVNATAASAIAAANRLIAVAHIESGLRSFDFSMPEERNRMLTDAIASLHFVSEPSGVVNLKREGVAEDKIHLVGNVMIDNLVNQLNAIALQPDALNEVVADEPYVVLTMHRPSNVDHKEGLQKINKIIEGLESNGMRVVFPLHPRTRNAANQFQLRIGSDTTTILDPLSYNAFIALVSNSKGVITDSGGIQEETSYLGINCVTFRENTERPITITHGTNQLVPSLDPEQAVELLISMNKMPHNKPGIPLWDGQASERIVNVLKDYFERQA